jgi:hypothetical protein
MHVSTALALYGLSVDAFLEGLVDEVEAPESFGLTKEQAQKIRKQRYSDRIKTQREGKAA